jgi:hypothetical protein
MHILFWPYYDEELLGTCKSLHLSFHKLYLLDYCIKNHFRDMLISVCDFETSLPASQMLVLLWQF